MTGHLFEHSKQSSEVKFNLITGGFNHILVVHNSKKHTDNIAQELAYCSRT